jgi:hypothetical protein
MKCIICGTRTKEPMCKECEAKVLAEMDRIPALKIGKRQK